MHQRGRVGGEDRGPPAAAPLHQPVAEPAEEGAGTRQREPFAVGRIRDDEAGARRRHDILEVSLLDSHRRRHAGGLGTGPRRLHGLRVEIAGEKRSCRRQAHPGFEVCHELRGQRLVTVAEAEEPVGPPPRPPQARRHSRGDRRPLEHERARTTQRIEERFAGGRAASLARPPPAGDREDTRGENFRERCLHLAHPPAPLMERAAGRVAKHRRDVANEVQGDPQRGAPELHVRPFAARGAELIDDGVLDDLRRVERVGEKRVVDGGVDAEGVGHLQLLRPIDLLHRPMQRLGAVDHESAEGLQHADRGPAFEHRPIERGAVVAGLRRKLDRPPADPQVAGPDRLQFVRQHPLQPLERPGGEPGGLVGQRSGQRAGRDGNVRKRGGAHACSRLYPHARPTTMTGVPRPGLRLPRRHAAQ